MRSDRVRAVRRLANRSFRSRVRKFLVEGPQGVREALRFRPDLVDEVYVAADADGGEVAGGAAAEVAAEARAAGLRVVTVPVSVLGAMCETVHPQGIAAVCRYVDEPLARVARLGTLAAVLHDVRDPGNAGTILRTADAAGADVVVFTGDSVDLYNGKCVRATAGSLFHIPVVGPVDIRDVIATAGSDGLQVLAATGSGETALGDADLARPTVWVFGNEAHGLPPEVCDLADAQVSIPIYGHAESLNLASAAAICLYASVAAQH